MAQYSTRRKTHYEGTNSDIHEVIMLADKDGNIINSFGSASNIPIASGEVDGYGHINKFGYTGTDINGTATVWDYNGTVNDYPYITTASTIAATSSANSGATIEVQGLDENYNEAVEEITIGGAASQTTFIRVFRAKMIDETNTAHVTFTRTSDSVVVAQIRANNGQTLMAVYTIPAGKTGYLLKFQGTMDKANAPVKFKFFARPHSNGSAYNLKGQFGTQGGNPITYDYPVPLVFAEKTDIKVNIVTGGTVGCGAIFDLILVDN